jgi:hypothetical protein
VAIERVAYREPAAAFFELSDGQAAGKFPATGLLKFIDAIIFGVAYSPLHIPSKSLGNSSQNRAGALSFFG